MYVRRFPRCAVAVHGRAARVHLDVARLDGHDLVELAGQRVVQAHGPLRIPATDAPNRARLRRSTIRADVGALRELRRRRHAAVARGRSGSAWRRRRARARASTGRRRACSRCASQRRLVVALHRLGGTPRSWYGWPSTSGPCAPSMMASMSSPVTVLWVSSACATARTSVRFSSRSSVVHRPASPGASPRPACRIARRGSSGRCPSSTDPCAAAA